MKSILSILLCFYAFLATVNAQERADSFRIIFLEGKVPLVVAHRGLHQQYPENSSTSIKATINDKIPILELDVRETKDGNLVVLHDKRLNRTTTGKGKVKKHSLASVQQLNLLHHDSITNEKVLSFKEALELAKNEILIDIDFKPNSECSLKKALQTIKEVGVAKQVLFYVYDDYELIDAIHAFDSEILVMPRAHSAKDVATLLKRNDIHVIHIDASFYSEALVAKMHAKGIRVWSNVLVELDEDGVEENINFETLLPKGVDVIQTDYPIELLEYLEEN
ncbi:glycerophosphoryl diester phosphodiesterase [Pustulibacterium marinum]|uniref:Glycerophosphoryl diester phosphodiesterase n=1 Tax=Pustulibacterium marinum TaxID=1224947 RepID=A0A1I7GDM2_9FLAO|nr:glycerophosphodiester phosphodiesterase family protein [Pustulibacterium marinum]SFU46356.1 glycerophosphoryl diester phosphodiesterase [Pustulibacterium marinum]